MARATAPPKTRDARHRRDALDQLAYEDVALPRLLEAMDDARRDLPQHGRILKLFVERLAVRQAAREALAQAFAASPDLSDLGIGWTPRSSSTDVSSITSTS